MGCLLASPYFIVHLSKKEWLQLGNACLPLDVPPGTLPPPSATWHKRDKARNTARITCRVCLEDFQTTINFLSELYNDWIDACETAN
uniref:Transcription elongation factor 1 homolog n=1 Tax=Timema bartmani TaxID=61472 RepID=A0A7R9F2M7_9NEOP|nr:unnamed protein product [Timema bartmani]